jgi:hypothetical protein
VVDARNASEMLGTRLHNMEASITGTYAWFRGVAARRMLNDKAASLFIQSWVRAARMWMMGDLLEAAMVEERRGEQVIEAKMDMGKLCTCAGIPSTRPLLMASGTAGRQGYTSGATGITRTGAASYSCKDYYS